MLNEGFEEHSFFHKTANFYRAKQPNQNTHPQLMSVFKQGH